MRFANLPAAWPVAVVAIIGAGILVLLMCENAKRKFSFPLLIVFTWCAVARLANTHRVVGRSDI